MELDAGDDNFVLGVREPHEYEIAKIKGATPIPLGQVARRVDELDATADVAIHCKPGVRSAKPQKILEEMGFSRVTNLAGVILRWSDEVDPSIPKR